MLASGRELGQPEVGVFRQRVERPPAQVQRLVTADDFGVGRSVADELKIEMTGRHSQRARHRVHVYRRDVLLDLQPEDAGLLGRLAQGGGGDVGVAVLAVPAELQPPAEPGVQGQQGVRSGVVEHQRGGRDVTGHALPLARILAGKHEREHRVPQRVLGGIGRVPGGQRFDRRLTEGHLRTSSPSVGAGSRGPDSSAG